MRIMGIDPGSIVTGYGIIDQDDSFICVDYGCIRLKAKSDFTSRLKQIYDGVKHLILQFSPDYVAFEDIFFGHNVKSAIQLGHARGAAVVAAANAGLPISYFSPREVKQAVTGFGGASKEQVQKMVKSILQLQNPISPLDASDALAIALCCAFRNKTLEIL